MSKEEEILSLAWTFGLVAVAIFGEFLSIYLLIYLNVIPAMVKGYYGAWIGFIVLWIFVSILWLGGMVVLISKKRRQKLAKQTKKLFSSGR